MSYPRTLDEIPSAELVTELSKRQQLKNRGLCPYCKKPLQKKESGRLFCECRFFDTETYHPAFCLNPLQYR